MRHLQEEQFDGWKHAACYKLSAPPEDPRIVFENAFSDLKPKQRCRLCARVMFPHGGEQYFEYLKAFKAT